MTVHTFHASPIGPLLLVGERTPRGVGRTAVTLTRLQMQDQRHGVPLGPDWVEDRDAFVEVDRQLDEYFEGARTTFDLPLHPSGTPFQLAVWAQLRTIPTGTTTNYGDIAERIGKPNASRAVGAAVGRNPISIIVPCHRVVGSTGALTGYAGGLDRKVALLTLEGALGG